MQPADLLKALGGISTRSALERHVTRSELERALRDGELLRVARNRYALPTTGTALTVAHALSAVLCLSSAALHHGWAVKSPPTLPHVSVRRNRKLTPAQQRRASIHRHDLHPEDIVDGVVTSRETTLLQCLRALPHDEALAIADSALRDGETTLLRRVAAVARGRGAAKVRRIAAQARAEAANPFESVTRSIALHVPGLNVEPQRLITTTTPWMRPDLVDPELRVVIEADSFEWHGDRAALRRDCRRYDLLVVDGWLVLRFAWEDVMFDPKFVHRVMSQAVSVAVGRTKASCRDCHSA
jgi:very-short-patch-repair endonuclease